MSALRDNYNYSYDSDKRNTINSREKINNRNKKKKKKKIVAEPIKNLMMISIVFVLGLVIISNYALITDKKMKISTIDEEIELLNKEKEEAIIALESLKNTNEIEDKAKNYLGMNYPTRIQTEFLEVAYNQNINTNSYATEKSNDLFSFINKATDLFN